MEHTQVPHDLAADLRAAVLGLARDLRNLAAEHSLTPTQTSVLGLLDRVGPLRASDIAAREGLNPTLVSRVLGGLEGAGHLTRRPDADDARAVRIDVSPSGRALAVEIRDRRTGWLAERLAGLSGDEVDSLLAALPALRALGGRR
ncbi:MAG: MarR family winged helix-turn-helix transcriptional regulator [Solirubrobacteraceae bacterium]